MIDPITAGIVLGGIQTGIGAIQRGVANRRRREAMGKFRYDIPSAVSEQVQMARARASERALPGEDIYRSRLESQMAGTTEKAESVAETASDILGMYAQMFGQKANVEKDIMQRGAEYQAQNRLELMRAMGMMADAQNQQFYYNKYVPFLSDMQMAGEMSAGGAANIASGVQTAYSGFLNKWMMDQYAAMDGNNTAGNQVDFGRQKIRQNSEYWQNQALPQGSWGNIGQLNIPRANISNMPVDRSGYVFTGSTTPPPGRSSWDRLSPENQEYLVTPGFIPTR